MFPIYNVSNLHWITREKAASFLLITIY